METTFVLDALEQALAIDDQKSFPRGTYATHHASALSWSRRDT
ncbi:hypothetical protein [Escherichia coli]